MNGGLFVLLLSGLFWSSSALSRPYHYINMNLSWPEAQSYCRMRYTDLATIDSMDDVKKLLNIIDPRHKGSVWIGLKNSTEKLWFWSNGENTSQYFNWAPGEPGGNGECVVSYNGIWFDVPCVRQRNFVCYKEGFGFTLNSPLSDWGAAQRYCRNHYTDLATIHNSQENKDIKGLLENYNLWIGLFRDYWAWSDQWSNFFRYWEAGHPSLSTDSGDCVGMSVTNSGKWSPYSCDLQQPFLCYGDLKLNRSEIVKVKISCDENCDPNDPLQQTTILNKISETLQSFGLEGERKFSWRKIEGKEVFQQENNDSKEGKTECQ